MTDVGSTKTSIHETVAALGMESCFVGGHPMAGSEKTGYESSTDHLLENAYYIITPTPHTPASHTDRMVNVAKAIGALPLVLDYHRHDFIVAAISHLPHLIASSLVNLVHDCDSEDQMMKRLAAGGFKDITRIASSSPVMWEQICMTNTGNITEVLDRYIDSLTTLREDCPTTSLEPSTSCLSPPATTGIRLQKLQKDRYSRNTPSPPTWWTSQVLSPSFPRSSPVKESVSKISASATTVSMARARCGSASTTRLRWKRRGRV